MLERLELPRNSETAECDCNAHRNTTELGVALEEGVREPSAAPAAHQDNQDRVDEGSWADEVIKLVIHVDPDGKYLVKGGGPKVWKKFRLRKEHRRLQGIIHGKRCGVTENIGAAARKRWKEQQDGSTREAT